MDSKFSDKNVFFFLALHKEILRRGMVIILDIKDFPSEQTRGIIIVVLITYRLSKRKMQL